MLVATLNAYLRTLVQALFILLCIFVWHTDIQAARRPDPGSLLIKNVTLVAPDGDTPNVIVNILIIDGKLDLVTQQEVSPDSVDEEINAQQGFLLGTLVAGNRPNFLILDKNPSQEFDIMLDTNQHILLAVESGRVVRNTLTALVGPELARKEKRAGWLAYSTPPVALPTSFENKNWNIYSGKYLSAALFGVLILDRQYWWTQNDDSNQQFGDLDTGDGGDIRALRFGVAGTLNFPQKWVYIVSAATVAFDQGYDSTTDDSLAIYDLRLDIPLLAPTTLSLGKQKEPLSMERIMGGIYLPMQERSMANDALLASRNVGAVVSANLLKGRASLAFGVFNDWLDDDGSASDNDNQYVSRFTWRPLQTEDESHLLHLGFGIRYSEGEEGFRYRSRPEFYISPYFVDTGFFQADDSTTYSLETSWRRGPLWLAGEYLQTNVDAPALDDPQFDGYSITAAWALTGEMREYNPRNGTFKPLPVARSVNQAGLGAWEAVARWSVLDASDGQIAGGEAEVASVGLNWWLNKDSSLSINYRRATLDRCSFITSQCDLEGDSDGVNVRITLILD